MRAFDWLRLFRERRVDYIERGANVKRDEVNIRCPFCGSADPSYHMGIELETGWYSCWRNRSQHSGKSPVRLIMKLLRVPYAIAREIAGLGDDYIDPEGFDAMAARLMNRGGTGRPEAVQRRVLRLDESFSPIEPRGRTRHLHRYLAEARGFSQPGDVEQLGRWYGVCAGDGKWSGRVVLPYYQDGELVTWTARAVGDSTMRYRDLETDESVVAPKETLFNHDAMVSRGRLLVIAEGPLDALKLDYYGRRHGVRAVALSTNSVSDEQSYLLQTAAEYFPQVAVMMDNASVLGIVDSMRMKEQLRFLPNLTIMKVPYGAKDPGELTAAEVHNWAMSLT